jgi:hypothetical protein
MGRLNLSSLSYHHSTTFFFFDLGHADRIVRMHHFYVYYYFVCIELTFLFVK